MRYVLMFLLFSTTSYAAQLPSPEVIFQISCERTYLRIMAEYFNPADLKWTARGLSKTCADMAEDKAAHALIQSNPVSTACFVVISQARDIKPSLPSGDFLDAKYCQPIIEK